MAVCDRCNDALHRPEGYAVWSEAKQGMSMREGMWVTTDDSKEGQELGAMIFCERCANGLFTGQVWSMARVLTVNIDPDHAYARAQQGPRTDVINFGIALRAKRLGFDAAAAKKEARRIAEIFWSDEAAAQRELMNQRRERSEHKMTRKWYEFWK